jgi:hypothetical protein
MAAVSECERCGYVGPVADTHALYAVLGGDRLHAMEIVEDWHPRERRETAAALTDLLGMVTS